MQLSIHVAEHPELTILQRNKFACLLEAPRTNAVASQSDVTAQVVVVDSRSNQSLRTRQRDSHSENWPMPLRLAAVLFASSPEPTFQ